MAVGLSRRSALRAAVERRADRRDLTLWMLAGIVLVGAAIRFSTLGEQSFWLDEAITHGIVGQGLGHVLDAVPKTESTPPLYYVLLWVWAQAFGHGEVALRSFSALCGTLTIPVMWAIGRRLVCDRVGLIAALLTAVNPFLFWYAQEARSYSLLLLLSALSLLTLLRATDHPSPRRVLAWGAVAALALCAHYFAAFILVPEAVWLLLALRRARALTPRRAVLGIGPLAAIAALLAPLAIHQNNGRASYIATEGGSLPYRLAQLAKEDIIGDGQPAKAVLTAVGAALVALSILLIVRAASRRERRGALLALSIGAGGVVLALVVSVLVTDYFNSRNMLSTWPAFALVVAIGFGAQGAGRLGALGTAGLAALGLLCVSNVVFNVHFQREDWRDAARALSEPSAARAVLADIYNRPTLNPYLHGLARYPSAGAAVREVDVLWLKRSGNWGPIAPITPAPLRGFHLHEIETASYVDLRYRSTTPRREPAAALAALYPEPANAVALLQRP